LKRIGSGFGMGSEVRLINIPVNWDYIAFQFNGCDWWILMEC